MQENSAGKGAWWELCTNMGHAVCASCSVSRAARWVSFTCTGSLGAKNQRRVGRLSTQRLTAVGTAPACHDCWQTRGRGLCPLPPFSQKECMCLAASACSLAMLMGFMTRLLAPEDRREKGGGGEVGGGGGVS